MTVYMACGHAGNANDESGNPVCVICIGINPGADIVVNNSPDLTGRRAKCGYNHVEDDTVESSFDLPFFEYLGVESPRAITICKCGYFFEAHTDKARFPITDHEFESHGPWEFDRYYCGCRGWD